jgi:hypothetical protein
VRNYWGLDAIIATIGLVAATPAAAQWLPVERNGNVSTIKHSNGSFIILTATPPDPQNKTTDMASTTQALAKLFGQQIGCSGVSWSEPRELEDRTGYWLQGDTPSFTCLFGTAKTQGKVAMAAGQLHSDGSDFYAEYVLVLQKGMSLKLAEVDASPPVANATAGQKAPPSPSGRTSLSATIAAIPVAHRPIGMAFMFKWDPVAMSMGFSPYMLFRGNVAIDADCAWNPSLPPTESARKNKCDLTLWRGTLPDRVYVGTDSNEESGGFRGFSAGERVTVNMSREGGGSVGGAFGGTSVLSGGELRMDGAGRIAIGSWTGTSTNGDSFSAYSSNSGGIDGEYYLDGYVLAIRDASGQITVGTVARKQEGRDSYMFVNGKQYWN